MNTTTIVVIHLIFIDHRLNTHSVQTLATCFMTMTCHAGPILLFMINVVIGCWDC